MIFIIHYLLFYLLVQLFYRMVHLDKWSVCLISVKPSPVSELIKFFIPTLTPFTFLIKIALFPASTKSLSNWAVLIALSESQTIPLVLWARSRNKSQSNCGYLNFSSWKASLNASYSFGVFQPVPSLT